MLRQIRCAFYNNEWVPMNTRKRTLDALLVKQSDLCFSCKKHIGDDEECDIDHMRRLADGGTDEFANKCVLCIPCHRKKTKRENHIAAISATEDSDSSISDIIRQAQPRTTKQVAQRYSILQLRGWWVDKRLLNAECNRNPVWDVSKQREFVWTILTGGATPPIFVNKIDCRREVYDGGNRLHAIMSFLDGDLCIHVKVGRRSTFGYFGPPKDKTGKYQRLDDDVQKYFQDIMVDVFEWENLSTSEATEIAMHLNDSTPMCIGEKLKLMMGRNTHRAKILKFLYDSDDFKCLKTCDRERELKILALLLRVIISPDSSFSSSLTSNVGPLVHFYKSPDHVEDAHIRRAENIIAEAASLLKDRSKGQRMMIVCFLGLLRENCDVQGAINDAGDLSVEELLHKYEYALN